MSDRLIWDLTHLVQFLLIFCPCFFFFLLQADGHGLKTPAKQNFTALIPTFYQTYSVYQTFVLVLHFQILFPEWKLIFERPVPCFNFPFVILHSQQFAEPLQKAERSLVVCGSFWKALSCKSISCHSLVLYFCSWQSRKLTTIFWIIINYFLM